MKPLVSVCILSMNHENYVIKCLESIANQDYSPLEIVYLDNNSKDRSFEISNNYLEKSGFDFRSFKREKNYLTSSNCNFLLNNAKGQYACLISADDWLDSKNISKKIQRLISDPLVACVYSDICIYWEERQIFEETIVIQNPPEGYVFDKLLENNFINSPGIVLDINKVKEVGGFREDLLIEDWDLLLRLSQKYKIAYVNESLVYYRQHAHNSSSLINEKYINEKLKVIDQYRNHDKYKKSRGNVIGSWLYNSIEKEPTSKSFKVLLKNFSFNKFYFQQCSKWIFTIIKRIFI